MAHDHSTHGAADLFTQILRPCATEGLIGQSRPSVVALPCRRQVRELLFHLTILVAQPDEIAHIGP